MLSTSTPLPVRIRAETWSFWPIRSSAPSSASARARCPAAVLVYRLVARKDAALGRNAVAVLLAAITAPVVNTGVFLLGMVLFFQETLRALAAGSALLTYALFTLAGVNFLVELGLNLVLSPAVSTLIRAIRKTHNYVRNL